jgi:hypothetical protein
VVASRADQTLRDGFAGAFETVVVGLDITFPLWMTEVYAVASRCNSVAFHTFGFPHVRRNSVKTALGQT